MGGPVLSGPEDPCMTVVSCPFTTDVRARLVSHLFAASFTKSTDRFLFFLLFLSFSSSFSRRQPPIAVSFRNFHFCNALLWNYTSVVGYSRSISYFVSLIEPLREREVEFWASAQTTDAFAISHSRNSGLYVNPANAVDAWEIDVEFCTRNTLRKLSIYLDATNGPSHFGETYAELMWN